MIGQPLVRPFVAPDWAWTVEWFRDDAINAALGPLDQEWLDAVLSDEGTVQLVVETEGTPVGLVGIAWDPNGDAHVITDIAVTPRTRRRGLGKTVLAAATAWPQHPRARGWVAFVDPSNRGARAFFEAIGWASEGLEDGMYRFRDAATRER